MNLRGLVEAVAGGRKGFQAGGESIEELQAFQPLVSLLLEADSQGYIEIRAIREESFSGRRFCYSVLVDGPTDEGLEFLALANRTSSRAIAPIRSLG